MKMVLHRAKERGYAKHGWLETHHSFSFANYFDPDRMGFGALRVINDDLIAPGEGFGEHPHNNMEIITIPLLGALAHKDNMGNSEVIATGEIQVMSAGTGVEHAEFNASEQEYVSLLQIWILPNKQNVSPRYDQKKFEKSFFTNKLETLVGEMGRAPLGIYQEAKLSLGYFDREIDLKYSQQSGHGTYFFVIEGSMELGGFSLEKRDALGISELEEMELHIREKSFILAIEVPMR